MRHYWAVQQFAWASAQIHPGEGIQILFILFRLVMMQCNWTFIKRITLSISQRKCAMLGQQSQNLRFVDEAMILLHSCFFSHSILLRCLPLAPLIVSLYYLPKMSEFNSHMRKNTCYCNLKRTFEALLPFCC